MSRQFRKHGWQPDSACRMTRTQLPVAAGRIAAPPVAPVELQEPFGRSCYRCDTKPGTPGRPCRLGKANQWARKHRRAVQKIFKQS